MGGFARNIGKAAVIVKLTSRPRRLQCRKLHVLVFDTHLEVVLAVNLREVIRNLQRLADFVRRKEVVASQIRQTLDCEGWKAAILRHLWDTGDSILIRKTEVLALRTEAGRMQVVPASARHIDRGGREDVGPRQCY